MLVLDKDILRDDGDLDHDRFPAFPLRPCSEALFHRLFPEPVAGLCNGNDPYWRGYVSGTEERYKGLFIGDILTDAPERVLG